MEYGAVALWLALYLALLLVGLPIASALFPRLADRGASVGLPLVLVVVFFLTYVVGTISLGVAAILSLVVLAAIAAVAVRRGATIDTDAYLETAAVFTAAFLFLVLARAAAPGITPAGGEKFLDFGLVQATLRADALPLEDFWFAGEPVLYYYGGHLLVGQLIRTVQTTPAVAYNLALAGFFGTYVTAAYGLAGNVAARDGNFGRGAALLGAFFVAVASNLFTPLRLLLRPLPDELAEPIARTIGVWAGRFSPDRQGALITDQQQFSMWDATGVIEGTIHETPLFAFVNGDLHAHMMAPAFTLLAATALFAFWQTPAEYRRRRLALLFGLVPAIAGALAVINTWSFPSVAGLTALAVLFDRGTLRTLLPAQTRTRIEAAGRWPSAVAGFALACASAVGVALLGVLWSLPFWLSNASGREVGVLPDRSALAELLVVHGGFLLPIALYLTYVAWARYDLTRLQLAGIGGLWLVAMAVTGTFGVAVLGLLIPLMLGAALLRSRLTAPFAHRLSVDDDRLARLPGFELVLLLGAMGLVLAVEFAFLNENAGPGRFNTVFKTYAQVWAFFAVGTAIALGRLLDLSRVAVPVPRWSTVLRTGLAVFVVTLSIYGVIAMGAHVGSFLQSDDAATLDGTAYVERYHPDEAQAIDWLGEREGTPTMVTKPGRAYSWTSAPSALTGVPTIIGWQHHERGFGRSPSNVSQRASDVDAIYTGDPATQRELLLAYNVSYVYVGPVEHEAYDDISIEELESVHPVRSFGEVTIYRVDRSQLSRQVEQG